MAGDEELRQDNLFPGKILGVLSIVQQSMAMIYVVNFDPAKLLKCPQDGRSRI